MTVPYWVAGTPATGPTLLDVRDPVDGRLVATTSLATPSDVEAAITGAVGARAETAELPAFARAAALTHVSTRIAERGEELARLITAENGKPIRWARVEVARAASTFRWAAEEARRWAGDLQRLDTDPGSAGRVALVRRVPRGPVLGITPFNFPLNLVAHKVAPAIAVGAPFVLKPAPATPLSALVLGEILAETDLPAGSWSILPTTNEVAAELVADPRLPVVSFTGSAPVGWRIRDAVPRKHVVLELGGNAAAVICPDHTDLAQAATRIATFAMYSAGQSCIAVQRVFVPRAHYDEFVRILVAEVEKLSVGEDVGPLIDTAAADRVQRWVAGAVDAGAVARTGNRRDGNTFAPTVLTDVPHTAAVYREEAFGPVVTVDPFDSLDDAFAAVNDSRFGLQTGLFTRDLDIAFRAHARLEVGAVIVGDVPSYRADQMPYGGVKDSGTGREGVRSAMHDLTDDRVLVLTGVPL
ncbi:aldehyde dehydrogenase family protein [Actinokineospora auranticolor]|uniref:Aldehyde dehydrogenase (NAD+) n=1 Tax=Actinokineospora auranticolor TaxID=155976 RepID=A0A2S6GYW3_9PSEU|nr:aldehyde dehydrogenase family protein [Actinokineospora auranticolor]PPK70425.1 aldehyde dehydrogenase (NAD+) [Actinokineospora auranticolor]